MTKIENRMMGVGCFARQPTLSRVLGRMMEAYSLGDWKDMALENERTSTGCVALRKLMSGKSEIAGLDGDSVAEEKIAGFFLAFENHRINLSVFTRRQGMLCSKYTACLDRPAHLRRSLQN
jgi:hypothetical protein